ncbi:MAG: GspH/FimT family pseudopilin [Pirellulales bacterium]|nr:GspH/FimT family pseudopilin [Pirellulales bacterium]
MVRRQSAGYTLVELLTVLVIVGILAALLIPGTRPSMQARLESAAQIVAGDLAYARSLAISRNRTFRASFQVAENRYTVGPASGVSGSATPLDPFASDRTGRSGTYVTDLDELPGVTGVFLYKVAAAGPAGGEYIEFGPYGETSHAEESVVWLAGGMGGSERYMAVRVNPVTGLATVDLNAGGVKP